MSQPTGCTCIMAGFSGLYPGRRCEPLWNRLISRSGLGSVGVAALKVIEVPGVNAEISSLQSAFHSSLPSFSCSCIHFRPVSCPSPPTCSVQLLSTLTPPPSIHNYPTRLPAHLNCAFVLLPPYFYLAGLFPSCILFLPSTLYPSLLSSPLPLPPCVSFLCLSTANMSGGGVQERDDTQAIGNHGNACSLSKCRPHQCWIASITALFTALFPLLLPTLSSLGLTPLVRACHQPCQHLFISEYLRVIDNPNWLQEPILRLLESSADSVSCVTFFQNKVTLRREQYLCSMTAQRQHLVCVNVRSHIQCASVCAAAVCVVMC